MAYFGLSSVFQRVECCVSPCAVETRTFLKHVMMLRPGVTSSFFDALWSFAVSSYGPISPYLSEPSGQGSDFFFPFVFADCARFYLLRVGRVGGYLRSARRVLHSGAVMTFSSFSRPPLFALFCCCRRRSFWIRPPRALVGSSPVAEHSRRQPSALPVPTESFFRYPAIPRLITVHPWLEPTICRDMRHTLPPF